MNKIPVGQTIRFAYAFTLGEIGTIIGLIWIPTLINVVASFFALGAYYQTLAESFESGAPPVGGQLMMPLVVAFLSMILIAMIGVAITRQALGLREGPAFAHFSLGSVELRVFGGFFGLYMLLVLFVLALVVVVGGVAVGGAAAMKANAGAAPLVGGAIGVVALAGTFLLLFALVRLSFLMIPAAVNDGEFGLTRSWQLTAGNFWRIVAVGAATLLPIALIMAVGEYAILGPQFFAPQLPTAADSAAGLKVMAQQMRAMQAHMPLLMGMSFVVSPLLYGLLFSSAAFAYRVLAGKGGQSTRTA